MDALWIGAWEQIGRTLLTGVLGYAGLIVLLRIGGKRTLAKLNAFDLVVTVALGSTLATLLVSQDVSLLQGVVAFALLILMQFVVTWTSVRWRPLRRWITGQPVLLFYRGKFLRAALKSARLTEDEVLAAMRAAGHGSTQHLEAVVLEPNGTISVIAEVAEGSHSTLHQLANSATPPGVQD